MSDYDLNLDNYSLEELLDLFQLKYNFDAVELKKARKICFKTHPDQSGLDNKFFLFYMKAYQMIEQIHRFREKKKEMSTDYKADQSDADKKIINTLQKGKGGEFGNWFNETFNRIRIKDNQHDLGYGAWLKSNKNISTKRNVSLADFEKEFSKEKQNCKALIMRPEITGINSDEGGYNLVRDHCGDYTSNNIFGKLKYVDLKKAHIETVIPVTQEDYNARPKFKTFESYRQYRDSTKAEPLALNEAKQFVAERNERLGQQNTERAFKILKQDEEIEKSHNQWWSYIRQLEDR